ACIGPIGQAPGGRAPIGGPSGAVLAVVRSPRITRLRGPASRSARAASTSGVGVTKGAGGGASGTGVGVGAGADVEAASAGVEAPGVASAGLTGAYSPAPGRVAQA